MERKVGNSRGGFRGRLLAEPADPRSRAEQRHLDGALAEDPLDHIGNDFVTPLCRLLELRIAVTGV